MPQRPEIHKPLSFKPQGNAKAKRARGRHYDADRRRNRDIYSSAEWTQLSKAFRRQHPLCVICTTQGRDEPAALVDHIVPISQDKSRAFDVTNLQSLCAKCHNIKTAREA